MLQHDRSLVSACGMLSAAFFSLSLLIGCSLAEDTEKAVSKEESVDSKDVSSIDQEIKTLSQAIDEKLKHPVVDRNRPHSPVDPHINLSAEKYAMVALGHLKEGRVEEALNSINQALQKHADSAQLFAVRSQIYADSKQEAKSLADLERAVALEPENPAHYVNRAAVYSKFDRDEKALDDLNKAVELSPDMLAARFNRGSLLFVREDLEGALADFEHCIAVDPHTAAPYFNRAAVYDAAGKREEAVADLERFLQLAPNDAWKKAAENLLASWQKEADVSGKASEAENISG